MSQSEILYFYQHAQMLQHHVPKPVGNIFHNSEIGSESCWTIGACGKGTVLQNPDSELTESFPVILLIRINVNSQG